MTHNTRAGQTRTFYERLDQFERQMLQEALEQAFGNELEAARALGLSLTTLQLKLERLEVDCRKLRAPGPRAEW